MENKYKNTFSGLYFLGRRDLSEYEKSEIVMLPAGYQGTTSYGKGTKNAPKAILTASLYVEPFDEEALFSLNNTGIHTIKIQTFKDKENPKKVSDTVKKITSQILNDKKFPVLVGGEHSLTIGAVQAVAEKYQNLSILQLDAHTDLDEAYNHEKYHHATIARTVLETTPTKITQVGVRSAVPDHIKYAAQKKVPIFYAHDIINRKHKIKDILHTLRKNVYITIDVDAFDPSVFPNTGTPEPNGLKWQYVINLIFALSKTRNIVGLDFVEHIPRKIGKRPHYSDFSAAKLLHKILCIIWKEKFKPQQYPTS